MRRKKGVFIHYYKWGNNMNQKYLMGMAAGGRKTVVFEATAPNVAAFISQNKMAPELLICTFNLHVRL